MAVDPNKVCHGRPCKNCGETLRWKRNHSCVACDRERYRTDEEYRERELERVREWYYNLDHIAYYERQLKDRRRKALKRKEARHANDT